MDRITDLSVRSALKDVLLENDHDKIIVTRTKGSRGYIEAKDAVAGGPYEMKIDKIVYTHEVNPPWRRDIDDGHIRRLKFSLIYEGYDISTIISVFLMPDGHLRLASGHHRVQALKEIGEISVPVQIIRWEDFHIMGKDFYRDVFIKAKQLYPQYYSEYDATLF